MTTNPKDFEEEEEEDDDEFAMLANGSIEQSIISFNHGNIQPTTLYKKKYKEINQHQQKLHLISRMY